jgi:hypothetical protein
MFNFNDQRSANDSVNEKVSLAVHVDNLALQQIKRIAPPPRAKTNQKTVATGALHVAQAAVNSLVNPNSIAQKRLAHLKALVEFMHTNYLDEQACDLEAHVDRSLAQFPAWRLLNTAGDLSLGKSCVLLHLVGVHLLVSMHAEEKIMSETYCDTLRRDANLRSMPIRQLDAICYSADKGRKPEWVRRYRREWREFLQLYESEPDAHLPKLGFNEIVQGQILNHATYPVRGQREAVLSDRSLSKSQLHKALANELRLPFTQLLDQKLVQWLTLFSGLTFEHLQKIPINFEDHILYIDLKRGCLHRNLRDLAPYQLSTTLQETEPAGMRCQIPLPRNLCEHLRELQRQKSYAITMGEIIPALAQIRSHDSIYPCLSSLSPSWARLKNTGGILLRQRGMDSLLVAILTGDFGHTMKSKLHYCNIDASEIHAATVHAHLLLGFDVPPALNDKPIGLGSPLVPTGAVILKAATHSSETVRLSRPGRNVKNLTALLSFHNNYTFAVALRMCFALALRNTTSVILPSGQVTVATEKKIAGHAGGMPVVVPCFIQQQVRLYQVHCAALLNRLPQYLDNNFASWLRKNPVSSLNICSHRMLSKSVSSTDAVRFVNKVADLPVDLGRKFFENELRRRGLPTSDIDRVMRHEVVGQASMSSTNFDSIYAWASRVRPILDQVMCEVFGQPLIGLQGAHA